MLKTALTAACSLTLLATAALSASLIVVQPPRANYGQWFTVAAVIAVAGASALFALREASAAWNRALAGGAGLLAAALGGWMVYSTLTGRHFEGYALVLGSALVVQGALTIAVLLPTLARASFAAR